MDLGITPSALRLNTTRLQCAGASWHAVQALIYVGNIFQREIFNFNMAVPSALERAKQKNYKELVRLFEAAAAGLPLSPSLN